MVIQSINGHIFYMWSYILYVVIHSIDGHIFYKWSYVLYMERYDDAL